MGRLEELKTKFPVKNVAPYGECLIVPGTEFNPDWEAELADQGIKVFLADLDQRPVTLVQVKKQVGVATPKEGETVGSELWSSDDEKKLLKRMGEIPGSLAEKISIVARVPGQAPSSAPVHTRKDTPVRNAPEQLTERLVCFEAYCRKCGDKRTVEDAEVWICCPVCGGPLIIWNVEVKELEE